jgi:segregation and condensation protein B
LNLKQAQAAIEAALFASADPISVSDLAHVVELDEATVGKLVREIRDRHAVGESGIQLCEVSQGHIFLTKPEYQACVERLARRERVQPLSSAALETLAIVAYKQPVTRGEIDKIRGVASDSALSTLVERGLVTEVGRRNTVGRPVLYGTTPEFLVYLGLRSLDDLPPLPEPGNAADCSGVPSE